MRLISTVSIAIALASVSSLAAPSASKCQYESDKVHISCVGTEHYPRDVEVTYNMAKRSDVELFLRRSDAMEAMKRGMDEEIALQERGQTNTATGNGDAVGNYCNFGNGNMGKRGGTNSCVQNGDPIYGPNGGTNFIGTPPSKRDSSTTVNGNGAAGGNHCIYGNSGKRDGASMSCTQNDSPIYGPNGGSDTIFAPRSFAFDKVDDVVMYHVARSLLPNASPFEARDEVCSGVPVGPVGAQVTYVTRGLPTEPTPVAAQKVARSISTPSATKPQKRCINTPIAPVAPTVTYESKAQWKSQNSS